MAATPLTSPERYELIDRIAVGGMAEVFRAVAYGAHGFEKALAIKRILPELARDPEFEERFIGEAKLAVKLSHANVVQVLDFGRLAGTLFIAMELVDGLDLAALLRRHREDGGLIPVPAAFHMAVEIARGLDFAHQHGVVHRDVSPSNILISRAGEVKIADFGIAQAAGDRRAASGERRRIMGKWRYMSPEQARGERLGTRSDLFSAAVVWFEMFTGDKLFPGDDADTIIDNIARMPIPRASERRPGLPPRLDDILAHALERDPARRPEKAAEILRALVEISYESSIVATPLDVADAVKKALAAGARLADGSVPAKALDDHIREQLLLEEDPSRRTAVASAGGTAADRAAREGAQDAIAGDGAATPPTATSGEEGTTGLSLVRRGVDPDGVTHWELDAELDAGDGATPAGARDDDDRLTRAAGPSALRTGRRASESPPIEGEPGGAASDPAQQDAPPRPGRRRAIAIGALAGLAAIAGAAITWRAQPDDSPAAPPRPAATARVVAGPYAPRATLVIDSTPRGARVVLDGLPLARPTPTSAEIEPDRAHRVELEREGYRRWADERLSVGPGETLRVVAPLVALRASLSVTSRPSGADVELDGEILGQTPLFRDDLRPGPGRRLVLRKPDHKPLSETIDLLDGERLELADRRLESNIAYGHVKIHIRESWAEVRLGGRYVGRAPNILKLPVGHQRLRLYNPFSKRERTVTVEVRADETIPYEFEL